MKPIFYTITAPDTGTFDLPKDMLTPREGDRVFIEGYCIVVDYVNFHVENGKVHMVSVIGTNVLNLKK